MREIPQRKQDLYALHYVRMNIKMQEGREKTAYQVYLDDLKATRAKIKELKEKSKRLEDKLGVGENDNVLEMTGASSGKLFEE